MDIHVRNIEKDFGTFKALDRVALDIESGELIALLGPSGSGKTTLLRVIAGLEFADQGEILFGNQDMARVPVRDRQVGFVFQHYALFKHMSVADNIAYGLNARRRADRRAARRPRGVRHSRRHRAPAARPGPRTDSWRNPRVVPPHSRPAGAGVPPRYRPAPRTIGACGRPAVPER